MSRMPIINFDEHFADFTSQWMMDHKGDYRNYDEMEADLPHIYMAFLNTRAKWLGSLTPGSYFTQFEDPKVLVDWMHEYCRQGVPVPDLLTEQIEFVGKPCEKRLTELLKDPEAEEEARMLAIGLLREMGSVLPKMIYINWQLDRDQKDEMKDNALEILKIEGNDYEVYSLKDLPANISFYAKNSSSEGFLFTENKLISLSEFSSVVNLNGFNSSNSEYSAVISKLSECLSGAEQAQKEYGEFNKKFTINFSTQNSLSLNLEVSLSNEGCCVLKILPDEGRSVLAYTIVSFNKTKCDELYNLLG